MLESCKRNMFLNIMHSLQVNTVLAMQTQFPACREALSLAEQ